MTEVTVISVMTVIAVSDVVENGWFVALLRFSAGRAVS